MAVTKLGCGTYEVYFKSRGGDTFICRARNLTSLTWGRMLNEVSEASITIALAGQDDTCCACIGSINPWEHEISIYRDGEEVWCGPIVNGQIDLETLTASFQAKDLLTWADFRWIELMDEDYEVEQVELTEVFNWVLSHGYLKDPWNMEWFLGQTGIPIDRTYTAFFTPERWGGNYPNVGEELRTLSKSGCDYTVIRRTMIGGDLETNPPAQLPMLTDVHWTKLPQIAIIGTQMATELGLAGGNGGYEGFYDEQMWIERPIDASRLRYGLLQKFYTEPTLDEEETYATGNAITQQAYGMRELKKEPFVYVKGGELAQNAPVDFNTLIPGATVKLALLQTCRVIESDYRLFQVDVSFSGGNETVSVQLTPEGVGALRA